MKAGEIVADASVLVPLFLSDEQDPVSRDVEALFTTRDAVAPALLAYEIGNIFLSASRRDRLRPNDVPVAMACFAALPVILHHELDHLAISALAQKRQLTHYDASYLHLAIKLDLPLASLDMALRRAAEAESVPLFGETAK